MKRFKHNLSHYKLFSCDMGELVPIGWQRVIRGDSFRHATSLLLRCSPLLSPVMHPVHVRVHHFYVPNRLIWAEWEDFVTGGPLGTSAPTHPYINFPSGGPEVGTLADYLGLPCDVVQTGGINVNALPFRAYALIWNKYFRDQDLQSELTIASTSGADTTTNVNLQQCAWEKDYYTAARPTPQKGADVTIPLGDRAPVLGIGMPDGTSTQAVTGTVRQTDASTMSGQMLNPASLDSIRYQVKQSGNISSTNPPQIFADLSAATGIPVVELRQYLAQQRFQEERSKFGSEYVDFLRYYDIMPSDARLQRPEYLGGGRQTIQFSEVLQTAPFTDAESDTSPVGQLRGHGIAAMRSNRYQKYFEEDGIVMSVISVKPKTMYYQGLEKKWIPETKLDYFQKEFVGIGQQPILYKEIQAGHATPNDTFGWTDRYGEFKSETSTIAGEFRTTELNYWHMARDLPTNTALNATFVSCVPTERTFAIPSNDVLWIMARHNLKARRYVPNSSQSFIY